MNSDIEQQTRVELVAALCLQNNSERKIAEQLGISFRQVRNVKASPEFKAHMKELADAATTVALNSFKSRIEELGDLAYSALKRNLEEGKIEGVKVWMKAAGFEEKQEAEQADTSITVIMPGAQQPAVEVKAEVKE